MKVISTLIRVSALAITVLLAACKSSNSPSPSAILPTAPGTLTFNSGFEPGTVYTPYTTPYVDSAHVEWDGIKGVDNSVSGPNDWTAFSKSSKGPQFGGFSITYDRGDSTRRSARIVADPTNPLNHVLRVKTLTTFAPYDNTSQEKKARVETRLGGSNVRQREFYQQVRLYLPNDFQKLVDGNVDLRVDVGESLVFFEIFCHNFVIPDGKGKSTQLYLTMAMVRKDNNPGSPLLFQMHTVAGPYNYTPGKWYYEYNVPLNESFPVPIGKWMTIEQYVKEGKGDQGRMYLAVTPDGGQRTVVYDQVMRTQMDADTTTTGFYYYSPMKFYVFHNTVDYMNAHGGIMQWYWDDFKLWTGRRP